MQHFIEKNHKLSAEIVVNNFGNLGTRGNFAGNNLYSSRDSVTRTPTVSSPTPASTADEKTSSILAEEEQEPTSNNDADITSDGDDKS